MKIPVNTPEGQSEIEMPDNWLALESTQAKIHDLLKKAFPEAAKEQSKLLEELVKQTAKQNDRQEKSEKEAEKDREHHAKTLDEIAKGGKGGKKDGLDPDAVARYNKAAARGEKIFTTAYDVVAKFSMGVASAAGLIGGYIFSSFQDLGNELNDLTAVGVGFTDSLRQGGMKTTEALADLSLQGLDAAAVLGAYSNVVASVGKNSFVELTKSFKTATNSGVDLGMALDKSIERFGNELSVRQQIGALDMRTVAGRQRQEKQITTTIKQQQSYSKALGISTDSLAEFSANLVTSAPVLTATLLRFSTDVRGSVTSALQDFGTAMMGMGGESGAQIATAMVDAAASGAMGFSEEMTGFVRAVPSLAGPMNEFISKVQDGTLSQEEANEMAQQMSMNLGNLSQSEKDRIFALARAGDAQAQSMAKAVSQFEQSSRKIKDINAGLSMEGVQKGSNTLNSMMSELTGAFDAIKYSFLSGVGESDELVEAFGEVKTMVTEALLKAFGGTIKGAADTTDGLKKNMANLGKIVADKLPGIIKSVGAGLAGFIEALPSIINGVVTLAKGIAGLIKFIGKFGGVIAAVVAALVVYKAVTKGLTAMKKAQEFFGMGGGRGGSGPDGKAIDVAGQSAERFTKTIAKGMKDISKGIKSLLTNVGEGISKFIKSISKGVASAVKTLADGVGKGLTAIGKGLGGFIKGMANGLTSLANPAALIGLAALVLAINGIAFALRIAGPGLESFGEMMKSILEGLAPVVEAFGKVIESVGKAVTIVLLGIGSVIESVGKSITIVLMGIGSVIESVGKAIAVVLLGIGKAFDSLGGVIEKIGGAFSDVFNSVANIITSFGESVSGVLSSIGDMLEKTFDSMGRLNGAQLFLAAGGIAAVGGALAALGAGKVVDAIGGFIGALFGQDKDPLEQLIRLGEVAPGINKLASSMEDFGANVAQFNSAAAQLEAELFVSSFALMSDAIYDFSDAVDSMDMGTLLKLAAMDFAGSIPTVQDKKPDENADISEKDRDLMRIGGMEAPDENGGMESPADLLASAFSDFSDDVNKRYKEVESESDAIVSKVDSMFAGLDDKLTPEPPVIEPPVIEPPEIIIPPKEKADDKCVPVCEAKPVKTQNIKKLKPEADPAAFDTMAKAAKTFEEKAKSFEFNQMDFATNDPEGFNKFQDRKQELYKEKFDEQMSKGKTRRAARINASNAAKMQAIEEFKPQIEAAGAGKFSEEKPTEDQSAGKSSKAKPTEDQSPVSVEVWLNDENQTSAFVTTPEEIEELFAQGLLSGGEAGNAHAELDLKAKTAGLAPGGSRLVSGAKPIPAEPKPVEKPEIPVSPQKTDKDTSAQSADAPSTTAVAESDKLKETTIGSDDHIELLQQLLAEAQKHNRLLRQQNQTSSKIADQI